MSEAIAAFAATALTLLAAWLRERRRDKIAADQGAVDLTAKFYELWGAELKRMTAQIDRLQALVVALENEVLLLGGDPIRIRRQVDAAAAAARAASSDTTGT